MGLVLSKHYLLTFLTNRLTLQQTVWTVDELLDLDGLVFFYVVGNPCYHGKHAIPMTGRYVRTTGLACFRTGLYKCAEAVSKELSGVLR
jgi:hypothetical protein